MGGTNGKGSVVAMVRSVLQAAGQRVGTMPKPHLVSYRERIAIDGEPISRERFAAAISDVLPAIDGVTASVGPPTEFEALTAAAMLELSRSSLDVAVVEVGMGGRLDATNVLDLGVAAITNVQHDHERYLGRTLALIGAEKAGIVKRGDLAVTGASGRGLGPILDRCTALEVSLRRAGPHQAYRAVLCESGWNGIVSWAVTRLATRRSRWQCWMPSLRTEPVAGRPCPFPTTPCARVSARSNGQAASSCSTEASWDWVACCSMARTIRRERQRWRERCRS